MSALSPSTARLLDQIWDAVDRDDQAGAEKLCRKNPKAGLPTAPPQLQAVIALALAGSERTQDQEASYLKLKSLAVSAKDSIWPDGLLLAKTVEKTALRLSDRDGFRESVQALANLRGTVASFWRGIARDGKAASDIVRQWILFHVGQKNWKDAQQATMGLRRSDPSNRDYLFWAILFSHLLSVSPFH